MATICGITSSASDPGLLFEDIWDPSVLSMFPSNLLDPSTPHCPLLAASSSMLQGTDPMMLGRFLAISGLFFVPTG
jgi:hypothetical protein